MLNADTVYRPMLNSLIISGGTAILTVVRRHLRGLPAVALPARGSDGSFLLTILFSTGLPITAVMVPVYAMYSQFELIDSIPATIAVHGRHRRCRSRSG